MDYFEIIVGAIIVIYSLLSTLSKNKKRRPTKQPNRSPIPDQSTLDRTGMKSSRDQNGGAAEDFGEDYSPLDRPHNFGDQIDNKPQTDPHFSHMEESTRAEDDLLYESSENRPGAYIENRVTLSGLDTHEDDRSRELHKSLENKSFEQSIGDQVTQDITTPLKVKKVDSKKSKLSTLRHLMQDKNALREGIILKEILDRPLSQRRR